MRNIDTRNASTLTRFIQDNFVANKPLSFVAFHEVEGVAKSEWEISIPGNCKWDVWATKKGTKGATTAIFKRFDARKNHPLNLFVEEKQK